MKAKLTAIAVAAALAYSGAALATLSKEELKAEQGRIGATFKNAVTQCATLKRNAKDICLAEADGENKVAKAELDARDKGTLKAQADARVARAEAAYAVAKERCDDAAGNVKDVCVADAKAALARAKADTRLDLETRDATRTANERVADAQQAATREMARADYDAARERCDRYAGDTRDRCMGDAKSRFGQ